MAGEIQLNSTTALTEDTGAITLNNVNSATNRTNLGLGSIATQASNSIDIDGGAIDGVTIGTNSAATDVRVDNLKLDGNTISSTNTDGNIVIDPNGAGNVLIGNFTLDADQTVGAGQDNMVLTYDYAQGTIGLEAAASSGTIASQDSDAVAITGGSITGTEFDLKSTGTSVYKSDGSTAVISESSGTVTVNNATLGSSVVFPTGTVLRVIQKEFASRYSHSGGGSGVWVAVSGFTQAITPASSSNKILVILHTSLANSNTAEHTSIRIKRDSTILGNHVSPSNRSKGLIAHQTIGTSNNAPYAGGLFLDSPNTTSSITYSVEAYTGSATFYMNYNSSDSDSSHYTQGISTLTLMEIQG